MLRVGWNTSHRANRHTLRFVKMADTFGATRWVNQIMFLAQIDGLIGAFWLADITIDALVGNHQRHSQSFRTCAPIMPTLAFFES